MNSTRFFVLNVRCSLNDFMFKTFYLGFFCLNISIVFVGQSLADPVYRNSDERGVPYYSSKPKDSAQQPVQLPNIIKAPPIEAKPALITCVSHGGIDCQAGPDVDGSVICYDKYRESIQRFANSCTLAKLDILEESFKAGFNDFSLIVRNTSAIKAKGVEIKVNRGAALEGPTELEPYDSAQYILRAAASKNTNFIATCSNCP